MEYIAICGTKSVNGSRRSHGALPQNEQDVHLFERLAFIAKREGR
jgi:hypothetical protein